MLTICLQPGFSRRNVSRRAEGARADEIIRELNLNCSGFTAVPRVTFGCRRDVIRCAYHDPHADLRTLKSAGGAKRWNFFHSGGVHDSVPRVEYETKKVSVPCLR